MCKQLYINRQNITVCKYKAYTCIPYMHAFIHVLHCKLMHQLTTKCTSCKISCSHLHIVSQWLVLQCNSWRRTLDDLALNAETRSELQHMLDVLDGACSRWHMTIFVEKTKVFTVGDHLKAADQTPITLQSLTLEDVTNFSYP